MPGPELWVNASTGVVHVVTCRAIQNAEFPIKWDAPQDGDRPCSTCLPDGFGPEAQAALDAAIAKNTHAQG